jgi:hypothetical protein
MTRKMELYFLSKFIFPCSVKEGDILFDRESESLYPFENPCHKYVLLYSDYLNIPHRLERGKSR